MGDELSAIDYHERTKHTPQNIRSGPRLDFDNKPRPDKNYQGLPRVPLTDDIRDPSAPALRSIEPHKWEALDNDATMSRGDIADLCYYAAGITKSIEVQGHAHRFRAAACTGALYHIDLYPVCGDLDGVDAGVYHFDPQTNTLETLREGDYRNVLTEATHAPVVEHAPVTFVSTSTWWRNAWKYRARTYRHAFWDSGTVLANLLATAHAIDQPSEVIVGFADDSVANLLGIDPEWEAPLELVPVGADASVPPVSSPTTFESINPATVPLDSNPTNYSSIYQAWQASTLPAGSSARNWRSRGERPIDGRDAGDGECIPLDSNNVSPMSTRPIHATIKRRGSCRQYARDKLSFQTISTIFEGSIYGVPMDVRSDEENGSTAQYPLQFVDCYCIVNGVDGVSSGAYQFHPEANELELLHAGEYREEAGRLALGQRLGADAAICVYFLTDLPTVIDTLGDRGYRAAQLEAAITAGRLYLATYTHEDLGGTGLTFFDDMVTEFFEPRAMGQTPMFLYTFGRPA